MNLITRILAVTTVLTLAACDSDNNLTGPVTSEEPAPVASLKVQVLHGSPDAPAVKHPEGQGPRSDTCPRWP